MWTLSMHFYTCMYDNCVSKVYMKWSFFSSNMYRFKWTFSSFASIELLFFFKGCLSATPFEVVDDSTDLLGLLEPSLSPTVERPLPRSPVRIRSKYIHGTNDRLAYTLAFSSFFFFFWVFVPFGPSSLLWSFVAFVLSPAGDSSRPFRAQQRSFCADSGRFFTSDGIKAERCRTDWLRTSFFKSFLFFFGEIKPN